MPASPHYSRLEHLRCVHELSMHDAQKALKAADERFDGDLRLGARFVHASQFAIMVHGDRNAWNERWARNG